MARPTIVIFTVIVVVVVGIQTTTNAITGFQSDDELWEVGSIINNCNFVV
jgi:hypothetical protein